MRLWTFKTIEQMDQLEKEEILWGDLNHIKETWNHFLLPYDWMKQEMKERIPCFSGKYPIWLWDEKPDLRRRKYKGSEGLFLVEIETTRPALASDFGLWHFALNASYLYLNKEMEQEFNSHILKKYGKKTYFDNFDEQDKKTLMDSWKVIFDFEKLKNEAAYLQYNHTDDKQYCLDGLKLEEVISKRFIPKK